jgi:probable selenium-dependent hydroxylase accessory protein YqeC
MLLDAFGFAPGDMVAAVGGGSKTSLLFRLALEARERGIPAAVTTTVKFTQPAGLPMPPVVTAEPGELAARAAAALAEHGAVTLISGRGERGRMLGFAPDAVDLLAGPGRLVLVEADGSAHRPFKAPAAHEPVIPAGATAVVVCVGAAVLGQPLDARWVHRPELAGPLAGLHPGAPVDAEAAARVLLHPAGGRKGVPAGARLCGLVNTPGAPSAAALALAERLQAGGYVRVVVATAHAGIVHEVRQGGVVSAPSADYR